jgi:hypothetical protein
VPSYRGGRREYNEKIREILLGKLGRTRIITMYRSTIFLIVTTLKLSTHRRHSMIFAYIFIAKRISPKRRCPGPTTALLIHRPFGISNTTPPIIVYGEPQPRHASQKSVSPPSLSSMRRNSEQIFTKLLQSSSP